MQSTCMNTTGRGRRKAKGKGKTTGRRKVIWKKAKAK